MRPQLHAAAVRALAPIHAPLNRQVGPQNATAAYVNPNRPASYALFSYAKTITDVTNSEPLFVVGQNGKLLCQCCVNCTGFSVPANATRPSNRNPNRNIQTDEWRYFKKALRNHLMLSSHVSNSRIYFQRQGLRQTFIRKDTIAGLNLIRLVYENKVVFLHISDILECGSVLREFFKQNLRFS